MRSAIRNLALMLTLTLLAPAIVQTARAQDAKSIVAYFKIAGEIGEQPEQMAGLGELFGGKAPTNMFDLLAKFKKARTDDKVKAVILDMENAALGIAQIQELRTQIEALRAADKDVWVFTETLGMGRLMLASAASKLVMMPRGVVELAGMYSEGLYFKRMLDKIGVQADIIHCGDYKSAGEPFYLEGPSKPAEEQTNRLIDSIFATLKSEICKSRKIEAEELEKLIDKAILSPAEAKEAGLVDDLMFREDFVKAVRKKYGKTAKVSFDYGRKKGPELDLENPFALWGFFAQVMKPKEESQKPAIAVVYVEGPITQGESEPGMFGGPPSNAGSDTVRKAIAEAAADKNVKALILRVDSPGGSAIASEIIAEATMRFKKSGRPFICSMGNVAGSGGYYVATQADSIFAQPSTITGSIGVVGGKMVTKGLWDWVGVTGHEYKRGKHADIMNTNRKFTEEEHKVMGGFMNRIYGEFKDRVTQGRGDKIKGDLESLAGGRVYTGEQAIEIGLVDRLGGFADAIRYTASEADIESDYELKVFPKPKSLSDIFAEAFGGGKDKDHEFIHTGAVVRTGVQALSRYAQMPTMAAGLEAVRRLDPVKARAMEDFLIHMELLSRDGVLLIGPSFTTLSK